MKNVSLTLLMAGFALGVAGCAAHASKKTIAGDTAGADDAAWKVLDSNADGYLSRSELEQQHAVALLRDMHRADANGDGRISAAEWKAWWPTAEQHDPAPSMQPLNRSSAPLNGVPSN